MTDEEKKAIDIIKHNDIARPLACGDITICNIEDLKVVLNLIQSQQKEIEILKSEIELHVDTVDEYIKELEEKDKIISNIENYIEKEINIRAEDILGIICNTETYTKNENNIARNINLRIIKGGKQC